MELVCRKPLNHIYLPSLLSKDAFCQIWGVFMSISDVTVTQYLNIPNFRPEKGGFGPLRAKGPDLRVVITNLRWPTV